MGFRSMQTGYKNRKFIDIVRNCEQCQSEFFQRRTSGSYFTRFCSRSCANKRIVTDEQKLKTSKSLLGRKSTRPKKKYFCKLCNAPCKNGSKSSCSVECTKTLQLAGSSKGGKKSAQNQQLRSRNEIEFAELCKSVFKNVETNKQLFNGWDADVIIHDIKTAVLWNGPWHYRKITLKHNFKQVQNRDRIKQQEIERIGYKCYIIKDDGRYNKKFVNSEFEKFYRGVV